MNILNGQPSDDWGNLSRYQAANDSLLSNGAQTEVVLLGNSITEGWVDNRPEFFKETGYIGRGIGGQTSPQLLVRFRQDVVGLSPRVVVILAGTNDIAGNTGPMTLDQTMDNIISMTELARANGIKVVLSSVLPAFNYPWRPGMEPNVKIPALNKMIQRYCQAEEIVYLDYFSSLTDGDNGLKPEYAYDGVHPTSEGYAVMEPLLVAAINLAMKQD